MDVMNGRTGLKVQMAYSTLLYLVLCVGFVSDLKQIGSLQKYFSISKKIISVCPSFPFLGIDNICYLPQLRELSKHHLPFK